MAFVVQSVWHHSGRVPKITVNLIQFPTCTGVQMLKLVTGQGHV